MKLANLNFEALALQMEHYASLIRSTKTETNMQEQLRILRAIGHVLKDTSADLLSISE